MGQWAVRMTHRLKAELRGSPTWQACSESHAEVGAWSNVDSRCVRGGLIKISLSRSLPLPVNMCCRSRKLERSRQRGYALSEGVTLRFVD
jgi:hypothetical protein